MEDGQRLYGAVQRRAGGEVVLLQGTRLRTLRADDVVEVIEGTDPYPRLAAATEPQGAEADAALAWLAWTHHLDADARRLGRRALDEGSPDARLAALLGRSSPDRALWSVVGDLPLGVAQRWGTERRKALSAGRGTAATEAAVARALAWLAAHQDEDGKLDADGFMKHDPQGGRTDGAGGGHHGERVPCGYDGVTTAVALMAWLASGSTPVSGPHRASVARALDWCVARVRAEPGGAYGMWNYGFCTQAVADAAMVTRDPALLGVLEGAVERILALQRDDGGWSYYLDVGDVPTTTVASTSLALAARAGVGVPKAAVAATLRFLDARLDAGTGRSEYHDGAERKGYTPTRANSAGALAVRALLGVLPQAPHLGKQVGALREKPVWKIEMKEVETRDGRKVRAQVGNLYPYRWYWTTVAFFERGGSTWATWFGGLAAALLAGQRTDGAFAGSWDPLGSYSTSAGRVFVTGLCALMLQAPYRYARTP